MTDRWAILRTTGARTLPLAVSLAEAGFEVWTPAETAKRLVRRGRTRVAVELTGPILPTFVFVRATHLADMIGIAADPASRHPGFSVFQRSGRAPLLSGLDVAGLRAAEAEALAAIQAVREADAREVERRERAGRQRTEAARRKALRSVRRDIAVGATVTITDAPMLAGMTGQVVESGGTSALVLFGGSLTMRIEAWQIVGDAVGPDAT